MSWNAGVSCLHVCRRISVIFLHCWIYVSSTVELRSHCDIMIGASGMHSKTFQIIVIMPWSFRLSSSLASVGLTTSFDMFGTAQNPSPGLIGPVGPRNLDPSELTMEYRYIGSDTESSAGRVSQWRTLPPKQTSRIMEKDHMVLYLNGFPFKMLD